MKIKALVVMMCLLFSTAGLTHSGGLDKKGGHNCSEKSKKKGLCSGYNYHRVTEVVVISVLDKAKYATTVASKH